MKIITFLAPVFLFGSINAIKFVPRGYQLLDPQTGRVLPEQGRSRVNFAPPFTDDFFSGSTRDPRQIYQRHSGHRGGEQQSLFPDVFRNNFYFNSNHQQSNNGVNFESSYRPHFRKERKVIPYHYKSPATHYKSSGSSAGRYQSSKPISTYAHKKRQKNPYYGRKKRSAEPQPYTLLDPLTGRNVDKFRKTQERKQKKPSGSFLFGIPFDIFNEDNGKLQENVRTQRKTPAPPIRQSSSVGVDPYLHPSSGIPLYKYRNKSPHGYGRKKRNAQWSLLDPVTGRTKNPQTEQKNSQLYRYQQAEALFEDPLEKQFITPEIRGVRQNQPEYVSQSGIPLYKYRQKYPHYG